MRNVSSELLQADTISCPRCDSTALNKYGRLRSGKQRYLCLVCKRQFAWPNNILPVNHRPDCPVCKQAMHVYMRDQDKIRFRCKNYPACHNYLVVYNSNL